MLLKLNSFAKFKSAQLMEDLLARVKKTVERYSMVREGQRVMVALSGGPDSVALLHVLLALRNLFKIEVVAGHVDHGLRGEESKGDAEFAERMAESLNVPFSLRKLDLLGKKSRSYGQSLQHLARRERYRALREMQKELGAHLIATGHHADDSVEWILLCLIKGTGAAGLCGIRPVADGIIRPLMDTKRKEIIEFLKQRGIPYRTDSSNLSTKYLRNEIRLNLIPSLEKLNPRFADALLRASAILRGEDEYLRGETEKLFEKTIRRRETELIELDSAVLSKAHIALQRRVIFKAFELLSEDEALHPKMSIIQQILAGLGECGRGIATKELASLPSGFRAVLRGTGLLLLKEKGGGGTRDYAYKVEKDGEIVIPETGVRLKFTVTEKPQQLDFAKIGSLVALLDFDLCCFPLVVRKRRPGDRIRPIGLDGRKKLKKLFIDAKIPRFERDLYPVVEKNGEIVAVVGLTVNDRFKITQKTSRVLRIEKLDGRH